MRFLGRHKITLGGVALPADAETGHTLVLGGIYGPSEAIFNEVLQGITARGDRAFVADPDGQYVKKFFSKNRGDVILDPLDSRSSNWDLFSEFASALEAAPLIEALLAATITGRTHEAASTHLPAQAVRHEALSLLTTVILGMQQEGLRDINTLRARVLALKSHPAHHDHPLYLPNPLYEPLLSEWNRVHFAAVRLLTEIEPLTTREGSPFNVRNWVRSGSGLLFVCHKVNWSATTSLVAGLASWTIHTLNQGPEGQDSKLWLLMDYLDTLGAMSHLPPALKSFGSRGGRGVFAIYNPGSLLDRYERPIPVDCENTLILQCTGSTAEYAAEITQALGPAERDLRALKKDVGYLQVAQTRNWKKVRVPSHSSQLRAREASA